MNKIASTFVQKIGVRNREIGSLLKTSRFAVHDWSHIYDGIYKFEDSSIGSDLLDLRTQALDFAKKKLSPFAIEWEKNEYFPVEVFREAAQMGYSAIYAKNGTGLSRL
jgi:hypothetical protein